MGAGRLVVAERDESARQTRWSARKKADVVMRLLRGESLEEVSRDVKVEAHRLAAWRDDFVAAGMEGLKANPSQPVDRRVRELERKVGELTLDNDILRAAARKRGLQIPPRKRPR
jgi:transposase-like protein